MQGIWRRTGGGWNDRDPKYDLHEWATDGKKMGKGVTLSKDELLALKELLNKMEL
jgi:hypothetical protein